MEWTGSVPDWITAGIAVAAFVIGTVWFGIRQHRFNERMQTADVRVRFSFRDGLDKSKHEVTIFNAGPGAAVAIDLVCIAVGASFGIASRRRLEVGEEMTMDLEVDRPFTAYLQWVHPNGKVCSHSFDIDPDSDYLQGNGWPSWLREMRPGRYTAEIQSSIRSLASWKHHDRSEWEPKQD